MKVRFHKRIGWTLILCGLVGAGITAAEIIGINAGAAIDSPSVLAESISGTLVPVTLGALLALLGLILVLRGWWLARQTKLTTGR